MSKSLGIYLKGLRKERKLKQKQLERDGVLNQSQLSKIEKGELLPNVKQILHLSDVYEVTFEDITPYMENQFYLDSIQKDERKLFITKIRNCVRFQNYHLLGPMIDDIKYHPIFKRPYEKQFLDWHLAIFEHEHNGDIEKGFFYINSAISSSVSQLYRGQYIEILNSKGAFYISQNQSEKALPSLIEAKKIYESRPQTIEHKIPTRLLYNLSLSSFQLENFKESNHYITQAQAISSFHESSYLKGELCFQYGLNQYFLKNPEEAIENMMLSKLLFKHHGQDNHLHYVCETMNKYKLR